MSLLRKAGPFLPLPALFLVAASLFARASGPFYLACRYDPEYAYLLNGLNVVLGWVPEHIDHPGTPLQLLWALLLRLGHPTASAPVLVPQVLTGAEAHLQGLSAVFLLGYTVALIWLGIAATRITGARAAGWLAQATPFLLGDNFLLHLRVNPEPFQLLVGLALIPAFLRLALSEEPTGWRPLAGLSLWMATGLCLKITFAPVALAALLLLPTGRSRARFAALTLLGCLVWTLPIMTQYPRFIGWVWGLAARQGQYGLGPAGLMPPTTYLAGLGTLLGQNPIYAVTLLAGLGVVCFGRRGSTGVGSGRSWRRLLTSLWVAQVVQLVISAKNPQSRYLAPAAALLALSWLAMAHLLRETWPEGIARFRRLLPLAAALVFLALVADLATRYFGVRFRATQHQALSRLTAPSAAGVRVYYYGASSPVYALVFGSAFAGRHYSQAIEGMLGETPGRTWFLNNWNGVVYSLRGPVEARELQSTPGPIYLHGDYLSEPERRLLPWKGTLSVLQRFEDETVYLVRPTPAE
jgi:hypothetical protein